MISPYLLGYGARPKLAMDTWKLGLAHLLPALPNSLALLKSISTLYFFPLGALTTTDLIASHLYVLTSNNHNNI